MKVISVMHKVMGGSSSVVEQVGTKQLELVLGHKVAGRRRGRPCGSPARSSAGKTGDFF